MDATKNHATPDDHKENESGDHNANYRNLLLMAALSFLSMYILMYAMVNVPGNVVNNLNEVYMAGLMAAPMIVIELLSMIPHHAGAITMCEEAAITEPEIQALCQTIVSSQQAEIDQMRALLEELE